MKTILTLAALLVLFRAESVFAQTGYVSEFELSACYFSVNPVFYGNPVEGKAQDAIFKSGPDLNNSKLCFYLLSWMVLPEDESYVGEFGTFIYQNTNNGYLRECKYEVVAPVDESVKRVQAQILNAVLAPDGSISLKDVISTLGNYEQVLNNSVNTKCKFVTNRLY